jgi:hypothetical protein
MATIFFADILNYLNAIADKSGVIAGSPHKRFWNIPYEKFITDPVPQVNCDDGSQVLIMNNNKLKPGLDPLNSAFYRILIDGPGVCGNPQMPEGGPLITDPGYEVILPDGTHVSGIDIQKNINSWLMNGFPEKPTIV